MGDDTASPFSTRTVVLLVVFGALAALAFLLASGFSSELDHSFGEKPPAQAKSGNGFYGLFALLKQVSDDAPYLQNDAGGYRTKDLLILTPEPGTTRKDMMRILTQRGDDTGPTLIVLPKWSVQKLPFQGERVQRVGWLGAEVLLPIIPVDHVAIAADSPGVPVLAPGYQGVRFPKTRLPMQTLRSATLDPLVSAPNGDALLARMRNSNIYILSDPDLIDNQALKTPEGAFAALSMLGALDPKQPGIVSFDTTLHYLPGKRNLIKLMFLPPYLGVTLALIAAAILAGIAAAARFGPALKPPRAIALGKSALVDNVAALTRLARQTRLAAPHYAAWIRDRTALQLRAPGNLDGQERAVWLNRFPDGHGRRFTDLEHAALEAGTETEMLRAAQDLNDWQKDITHDAG